MPSDPVDRALRDIFHHIDLAAKFVEEMDRETFKADLRAFYAVTRYWRSYLKPRGVCQMS